LLITHVTLSAVLLPLLLSAVWLALSGQFEKHRRLSQWVWPMWIYVSVTGVLVYLFLKPYY
jgi:putative membrane protein